MKQRAALVRKAPLSRSSSLSPSRTTERKTRKALKAKPRKALNKSNPGRQAKVANQYTKTDPADYFDAHVDKSGDCWRWTGTKSRGYGVMRINGARIGAHRYSFERFIRPAAKGEDICHTCDNPGCVRPDHLFAGTASDNMRDASRKGRLKFPQSDKKTCANGHEFTEETIGFQNNRGRVARFCRICRKASLAKSNAKRTLRPVNPERQSRRRVTAQQKHRLYMASETRRIVDARADGRCERATIVAFPGGMGDLEYRCSETEGLEHHHKTYARYGGAELPADMLVVCKRCHEHLESLKPARNRLARRT